MPSERRWIELELGRAEDELRAASSVADEILRARAALPGQVADQQRRVNSNSRLMSFGLPAFDPVYPARHGSSSFSLSASGLPGTGGTIEGALKAVPVSVEGEVKGEATIKVEFAPTNEFIRLVDDVKSVKASMQGALRQQNGPGSTGLSSPDAGAGGNGRF